jgi:hypothetical protein
MAVYPGKKEGFPNYEMFVIDGSKAPEGDRLTLLSNGTDEETPGWRFPHGSTGLYSLGDGRFYVSHPGSCAEGHDSHVRLYRWNGTDPLVPVEG